MGVRNWLHNKRLTDPVEGTYRLTSCSANSGGASYQNCRMHGVVSAPGIEPVAVEHYCTAPTKRWPQPGSTLPVTVDRADPTRLQIEWDKVPTGAEQGSLAAEQLAASMRGEATVAPPGTPSMSSAMDALIAQAQAQGVEVTTNTKYDVIGAPGRPIPGAAGGGLTPDQAAAAASAPGMQPATATVLAAHEITVPPGTPGAPPAGLVDLTLDVSLHGGGWSTTMRIGFSTPEKRARVATIGAVLPVFVNPQAHDQIAIDGARLGL